MRLLSARDEQFLARFVRDTDQRLAKLESQLGLRNQRAPIAKMSVYGLPTARVVAATLPVAGDLDRIQPTEGEFKVLNYRSSGTVEFKKQSASRANQKFLNLHPGMWVWDDVPMRFVREEASGIWIADNLGVPHVAKGKANAVIAAGATGPVQIFRGNTSAFTIQAKHDWMDGGQDLASGKDVIVQWFDEDLAWRIIGAEC